MISQVIGNVLMFVPFGFLLSVVFKTCQSPIKTLITVASFSFSIEFVQYFIGRSADIDDLILNTLGGMLGFGMYLITDKWLFTKINGQEKNEVLNVEEEHELEEK